MKNENENEEREPEVLAELKRVAQELPTAQSARVLECVARVRDGLELATELVNWLAELDELSDADLVTLVRARSRMLVEQLEQSRELQARPPRDEVA
jgi:hypothetical protein